MRRISFQLFFVLFATAYADQEVPPCDAPLAQSWRAKTIVELKKALMTGGLSLFFTRAENDPRPLRQLFFRERDLNYRWWEDLPDGVTQYLPRKITTWAYGKQYDFTPIRGVFGAGSRLFTASVSRLTWGKWQLRPTFFTELATTVVISGTIFYYIVDQPFNKMIDNKIIQEIKASPDVAKMIESDYRLSDIRERLRKGEISAEEANIAAAGRRAEWSTYVNFINDENFKFADNEELLLNLPLFRFLVPLVKEGVPGHYPGFRVDRPGMLSPEKKEEVFKAVNRGLIQMDLVAVYVASLKEKNPEMLHPFQDSAPSKEFLRMLTQEDPFHRELKLLVDAGRLTIDQFQWRLQQYFDWKMRYELYTIIGIVKLKMLDESTVSDEPLAFEAVAEIILKEAQGNVF